MNKLMLLIAILLIIGSTFAKRNLREIRAELIEEIIITEEMEEIIIEEEEIIIIDGESQKIATPAFPTQVVGGWICRGGDLTADDIINAGFNVVFVSFYDITTDGNLNFDISDNRCCEPETTFEIARGLISAGIPVLVSIGGDGCQGAQPQNIKQVSDASIVRGFKAFQARTKVQWSGLDIDWEQSNSDATSDAINQIGRAMRGAGYHLTAVPMSSQFVPGGLQGWKTLDPEAITAVSIQWYQGGCVGTQSCPCWGDHALFDDTCPGFKQSYMQQARKCGTIQWIEGFQNVGGFNWPPEKIIIGVKSWCGGDLPMPCSASDTGIWGYEQMSAILQASGVLGISMWDIDDYFIPGYFRAGNPISANCDWILNLEFTASEDGEANERNLNYPSYCAKYTGPFATNCYPNPW